MFEAAQRQRVAHRRRLARHVGFEQLGQRVETAGSGDVSRAGQRQFGSTTAMSGTKLSWRSELLTVVADCAQHGILCSLRSVPDEVGTAMYGVFRPSCFFVSTHSR